MATSNRRCPVQNAIVAALGAAATPYCSSFLSITTQTYTDVVEAYVTSTWTDTSSLAASTVTTDPFTSTAVETTVETTCTYPPRALMPRGAAKTIVVTATTTICPCTEASSKAPCTESVHYASSGYSDSSFAYATAETSSSKSSSPKTSYSESVQQGASGYSFSYIPSHATAIASIPSSNTAPYYSVAYNSSVHPSGSYSYGSSLYSYGTSVYSSGVSSYTPEPSIYSSESSTTSEISTLSPTPTPTGSELLTTIDAAGLTSACSCLHLDEPTETVLSTTTLTSTETTVEYAVPTITATPTVVETFTVTSTSTTECCTLQSYYTDSPNPPTDAICGIQYVNIAHADSFGGSFTVSGFEECRNIIMDDGFASFYFGMQGAGQSFWCGFFTESLSDVGPYDEGGWKIFFDASCFISVDPCIESPASTSSLTPTPSAAASSSTSDLSSTPPTPTPSAAASSSISELTSVSSTIPAASVCTATPYNTANPTPPDGAYCERVFAVPESTEYVVETLSTSSIDSCRDTALANVEFLIYG
ncbi:hypothetical protein BU16DRAFT_612952 [Lophium mytilinum]|uniref:Uncharacterized protein n=1 Tax=Lophium mytilinum TaxID=390894 RepID=A0A6A6R823_9PEZI|nr:hypothetical protein BU16DRAFT_612952 [Lophium mytilinum]